MKLLVLYEELAAYFLACVSEYSKTTGSPVFIIAKEPNKVAPFQLDVDKNITIVYRESLSEEQLQAKIKSFQPEAIFSGGWGYKPFRKICAAHKKQIPVLIGFDNWWTGDKKQKMLSILSAFTIRKWYNCCFVPGEPQKQFALKLGFKENLVHTGAYCCDSELYKTVQNDTFASKKDNFPKRFLFVGRYEDVKGIDHLWDAFEQFKAKNPEWELWCAGKGSVAPRESDGIKHYGFVQPHELKELIKETGIFILPSVFEPWGVVIHEMAIAGMPQISTPEVGAAARFIEESNTGYIVQSGSTSTLLAAMESFAEMNDQQLYQMAEKSANLGESYTVKDWTNNVLELFKKAQLSLR